MRNKAKSSLVLCILFSYVLLSGFICTGSQIHKATVAEHDFKSAVQGFQNAEIAEFNAGHIDPTLHAQMQEIILKVAQGGVAITTLLQQSNTAGALQQITNIDTQLQTLLQNGVLAIKNPTTVTSLQTALLAVQAIVTNIQTALS